MKEAIERIQKHARELKKLEFSEQYLFEQLNSLSPDLVEQLIADFTSEKFQPVNLLRLDILHKLKNHVPVTLEVLESIKQKIIERDEDYFSQYGEAIVTGLLVYPQKKKSPFSNWRKTFSILFPFFYPPVERKEVDKTLHGIAIDLQQRLQVPHYKYNAVSFWGTNNYGSSYCWIALFPRQKVSHRKAYQLFLRIDAEILEAGMMAGWDINDKPANTLEDFNSIEEVIEKLKASREAAEKKNNASINYWKFAPGENGIHWEELKETKGLEGSEVFINNQGSLFSLTPDEFEIIRDLIDERNILSEKEREEIDVQEYSFGRDPDMPFLDESELQDILYSLQLKKNIVLQGPPGVGKTFVAKKIAYEMMQQTDDTRIKMVQFHQSYAYEDFIQGIRPVEKLFKVKNGVFYEFCKKAELDPENQYFFIIDEINRGNLSKIFGELMMLIESDKRGTYSIPLTYSEKDDAPFSVPENLYLIGTMNTADRSLAIVDYALRRRFRFITLEPSFNQKFLDFLETQDFSSRFLQGMIARLRLLNDKIRVDKNLGSGFLIGHSYFCNHRGGKTETEWFEDIVKFEIAPLLEEYWFDDPENAAREVELLLA